MRYENDATPSREVAQRYREAIYDEDCDVSLALLHYRGGEEEFLLGNPRPNKATRRMNVKHPNYQSNHTSTAVHRWTATLDEA